MAETGKPQYRTEYRLQRIGGDDEPEYLVDGFSLTDVLSEGYVLDVQCAIPAARHEGLYQACASRRLQDVEFWLRRRFPDGSMLETRIVGLINSIQRSMSGEPGRGPSNDTFTVRIVPALALLRNEQEGGTWHNRSHADVLYEVLRKGLATHGRSVRRELRNPYPEIDFTVRQPNETLYDFAQKLMARTGISFWFDHSAGVETLVLCDGNEALPEGNQRQRKDNPFRPQWMEHATDGEERIVEVCRAASMAPSQVEFIGFDVKAPQLPVQGLADLGSLFGALSGLLGGGGGGGGGGGAPATGGKVIQTEPFRVNELAPEQQFKERAKLHSEIEGNRANQVEVKTTITGALAGRRYRMEASPGEEREYVLAKVVASGRSLDEVPGDYTNAITAVPTVSEDGQALPIRPTQSHDEGKHFGVYRAKVVAVENDPLDVDGFLRCRLEFPWDQQGAEPKTTYVSVLQPMAGSYGGTQWLPRAGDRCLVTFVGGNSEQPVILGCLYDNEMQPPLMGPPESAQRLPAAASWLGWNHASVGDRARQSMLCMDVTAGQELMFFGAPQDWRRIVGNDSKVEIGRNDTIAIGGDETRTVEGEFSETVAKDWRHHVGGNRSETVAGDYSLKIAGNGVIESSGGVTSTMSGPVSTTCKSGASENVFGGNRVTRVPEGSCMITAGRSIVARAPSVSITSGGGGGSGGMGAAAGGALQLAQAATLSAPASAAIESGPSQVRVDETGAQVRGPAVSLADAMGGTAKLCDGKLVVDAPQGIELRCGANTLRLAPDGVYVNGARLVLEAPQVQVKTAAFDIVGAPEGQGA